MNFAERFKDRTVFVGRDGGNAQLVEKVPPLVPTPPPALPRQQEGVRIRQKSDSRRGIYAPGERESMSLPTIEHSQHRSSAAVESREDHPYSRASQVGGRVPVSLDPKQLRDPQRNGVKERGAANRKNTSESENGFTGNLKGASQKSNAQRPPHNGNGAMNLFLDIVNEDDRNGSSHLSVYDERLASVTRSPMGHYRSVSPHSQKSPRVSSHFGASTSAGTPTVASRKQSILHAARQPREGSQAFQYQRLIVAPPAPPIQRTSSQTATSPASLQSVGCDSNTRRPMNDSVGSCSLKQRHSSNHANNVPPNQSPPITSSMNHSRGSHDYDAHRRAERALHDVYSDDNSSQSDLDDDLPRDRSPLESFRSTTSSTLSSPPRQIRAENKETRRSTTQSTSLFKCTGLFAQTPQVKNTPGETPQVDRSAASKRISQSLRGKLSGVGIEDAGGLPPTQQKKRSSASRLSFTPPAIVVTHQDAEEMGSRIVAEEVPEDTRSVSYRRYLAGLQRNPTNDNKRGTRGGKTNDHRPKVQQNGRPGKTMSVHSREGNDERKYANRHGGGDRRKDKSAAAQRASRNTRPSLRSPSSASGVDSDTGAEASQPTTTFKPHTLEDYKTILRDTQTMKMGGLGFADTDEQREAKERSNRAAAYAEVLRQKERMKLCELRKKREAAKILEEQQARSDADALLKPSGGDDDSLAEEGTASQASREAQIHMEEENAARAAKAKEDKLRYLMYYGNADNYVTRRDSPQKEGTPKARASDDIHDVVIQESVNSPYSVDDTDKKTLATPEVPSPPPPVQRVNTPIHAPPPSSSLPVPDVRKTSVQKQTSNRLNNNNNNNKPPVQRRLKDNAVAKKTSSVNQSKPPLAVQPNKMRASERKAGTCVEVTLSPLKSTTDSTTR